MGVLFFWGAISPDANIFWKATVITQRATPPSPSSLPRLAFSKDLLLLSFGKTPRAIFNFTIVGRHRHHRGVTHELSQLATSGPDSQERTCIRSIPNLSACSLATRPAWEASELPPRLQGSHLTTPQFHAEPPVSERGTPTGSIVIPPRCASSLGPAAEGKGQRT